MKVMIRKDSSGALTAYIAKKDLEEAIVEMEKPEMYFQPSLTSFVARLVSRRMAEV